MKTLILILTLLIISSCTNRPESLAVKIATGELVEIGFKKRNACKFFYVKIIPKGQKDGTTFESAINPDEQFKEAEKFLNKTVKITGMQDAGVSGIINCAESITKIEAWN